jgi:hypothetical protein
LLLEGNWLSGTIPSSLGNLVRARKFCGAPENAASELPQVAYRYLTIVVSFMILEQISLRKNYLSGRVASELCELRNGSLTELKVDSWIECDCCTT